MKKTNEHFKALLIFITGLVGALFIILWDREYLVKLGNFFASDETKSDGNIILTIIFMVSVFLIVREIFTWYWKINRIVRLLEKIERNTNKNI